MRSNDAYAWGNHYAVTRSHTANGRNEYSDVGGNTPAYDDNRNMTSSGVSGTPTYTYNSENMLTAATGGVTLSYDPAMRLYETAGGSTTRMAYDGDTMIAEYNGSNAVQRRYVYGPGSGAPLVSFEGSGTSTRVYYHEDERGSVIARSDGSGAVTNVNAYDEYGIPASGNTGRFQYTGQQWLPELGMQHSRARIYSPTMGRFLQTDPIGYAGGMNLHAYVGNDPVNMVDPMGLDGEEADGTDCDAGLLYDASPQDNAFCQNVYVTGRRLTPRMQLPMSLGLFFFGGGGPAIGSGSSGEQTAPAEVVNCPAIRGPYASNEAAMLAGARIADAERLARRDRNERHWTIRHARIQGRDAYFVGRISMLRGCNANLTVVTVPAGSTGYGHSHRPDCGEGISDADRTAAGELFADQADDFLFGFTNQNGDVRGWREGDSLRGRGRRLGRIC